MRIFNNAKLFSRKSFFLVLIKLYPSLKKINNQFKVSRNEVRVKRKGEERGVNKMIKISSKS